MIMMMIIVDYDGQQSGVKHELFGQGDVRQCSIASQNVQVQCQCRIKLLGGGLCQTQMGAPVLCHSLVPIPAVSLTASRLKWGLVPIDIMMASAFILTI